MFSASLGKMSARPLGGVWGGKAAALEKDEKKGEKIIENAFLY